MFSRSSLLFFFLFHVFLDLLFLRGDNLHLVTNQASRGVKKGSFLVVTLRDCLTNDGKSRMFNCSRSSATPWPWHSSDVSFRRAWWQAVSWISYRVSSDHTYCEMLLLLLLLSVFWRLKKPQPWHLTYCWNRSVSFLFPELYLQSERARHPSRKRIVLFSPLGELWASLSFILLTLSSVCWMLVQQGCAQ